MNEIRPQAGPQEQFLSSPADIVIFGGGAGGGKTFALLMEPLRHIGNGRFGAVIFRRTYPQVTMEGGMWNEASAIYPRLGASIQQQARQFTFGSGASVAFAHMQHEDTKYNYDGSQIALLMFDQLEQFTESQFFYMLTRNRSTCGVRPYVRATCNPMPDSWLESFLSWWIEQDKDSPDYGYAIKERCGRVRWFVRQNKQLHWADTAEALAEQFPDIEPKSVTFILATVYDNQILMQVDPSYLSNLKAQDYVEYMRLLGEGDKGGNWKVKPSAGKVFNRDWFIIEETPPTPYEGIDVLFWDLAATAVEIAGSSRKEPSWTAGVHIRYVPGRGVWVLDMVAFQAGPAEVEARFLEYSRQRAQAVNGRLRVRWEQEPGSASKREAHRMAQELAKVGIHDARGIPSRQDKMERARPAAGAARRQEVHVVRGHWNERFISHLHAQPQDEQDIMDAFAGAYNDAVSGAEPGGGMSVKSKR